MIIPTDLIVFLLVSVRIQKTDSSALFNAGIGWSELAVAVTVTAARRRSRSCGSSYFSQNPKILLGWAINCVFFYYLYFGLFIWFVMVYWISSCKCVFFEELNRNRNRRNRKKKFRLNFGTHILAKNRPEKTDFRTDPNRILIRVNSVRFFKNRNSPKPNNPTRTTRLNRMPRTIKLGMKTHEVKQRPPSIKTSFK